ncbi:MAG: lysophospholipid acyltransferase family protein [Candidatus Margulisiibacteriota bacterium]|jgi:1-acyl-sn-glycerol-3-phosphate acyltransferase
MNLKKISQIFYSFFFILVVVIGFILHFIVAGIFMWISKDPEYAHLKLSRPFITFCLGLAGVKFIVHGLEQLPQDKPFIIMSNHNSLLDVLAYLVLIPHKIAFIPKEELLKVPILGLDIILQGHYPINRKNPRLALKTIEVMKKDLVNGRPLLFFPEGSRSANGKLGAFKRGGFLVALETGTMIIPSYVAGTDKICAKKSLLLTPGEVHIYLGQAIKVEKIAEQNKAECLTLIEKTREAILGLTQKV